MGYVDKKVALQYLANSESLFDRIKTGFIKNHDNARKQINQFINESDYSSLYNYIHSIKGVSLNIGSMTLFEDAEAVLNALKKGETNVSLINIFIDTLDNVLLELKAL